ncbi:MAG: FtsX-like permease family protein [Myxococcota bacterium]
MSMLVAMAWRNLWRHSLRTGLTALAMGSVVAIVIWLLSLQAGIRDTLERVGVTESIGHAVIQHPDFSRTQSLYDTIDDAEALLASLDDAPGTVAVAPRVHGNALLGGEAKTVGVVLRGIDPVREYALTGLDARVFDGEALAADPSGGILLGVDLASSLDVAVGEEVVAVTEDAQGGLGNALYTVSGILRTGDPMQDRSGAVLHIADLQSLMAIPDAVHDIALTTTAIAPEVVEPWLDGLASTLGKQELRVRPWWDVSPALAEILELQSVVILVLSSIFLGIAALVVVNSLLMSVYERTREFGVLRALGLRPFRLVGMVFIESAFMGGLASTVGLLLGGLVVAWMTTYGLDLSVGDGQGFQSGTISFDPIIYGRATPAVLLVPIAITFVCALFAGVLPALRAASVQPIQALREG